MLHAHVLPHQVSPREGGLDAARAAQHRAGVRARAGLPLAVLPHAQTGTQGENIVYLEI